jgi:PTS system nitrogen regulatory IIA component
MKLGGLLRKNLIYFGNEENKHDILERLIRLTVNEKLISDIDVLRRSIFYREELMSTGIGLGVAVPHARIKGVSINNFIISIGINREGIKDYDSIDGIPVKIVIMIISGEKQHREYLKLLAQIVSIIKNPRVIDKLLSVSTAEEVIKILSGDEIGE